MIHQISELYNQQMETVCRGIADAFTDYPWSEGNLGMCEYLDREHFYRFVRGYIEAAVRNGSLYSAGENGEAYMILETPETKNTLAGSLIQLKWMLRGYGVKNAVRQIKEIVADGDYLSPEFKKRKQPFVKIELIVVMKAYQHQGYMRQMMEFAFAEADKRRAPCILTTDDIKKVQMYEHYGMKMVKKHHLKGEIYYFEMLRDAH